MNIHKKILVRKTRIRAKLKKVAKGRFRLSVFRSLNNIYAQIIDDKKGTTVISSSTLDKNIKSKLKGTGNKQAAEEIGKALAEKAKTKGIKKVICGYLEFFLIKRNGSVDNIHSSAKFFF